ncbi:MAG: hypothetical protein RJA22_1971 [Verrucomicrobiota bacterium]
MASARSILILSIGCNLLLAGWLAARVGRASVPAAPAPAESAAATAATPRVARSHTVEFVTNRVEAAFSWARLETNDFRAYAANLRAVGCPETTLRHILLPDIEKAYDARQQAPAEGTVPFWATAAQASAQARAMQGRRIALEEEKRALLRELTGVEWTKESRQPWVSEEETLPLLLGFLPDEKAMAALEGLEQLEKLKKRIDHETRGLLGDEDEAPIRELARAAHQGFLARLTPQEAEEWSLRLLDGLQGEERLMGSARRYPGLELTGAELRQLVQWSGEGREWVAGLLVDYLKDQDDSVERLGKERPPGFEARVQALLGEQRHAAYVRSQDPNFQWAVAIADRAGLPESVAIQAHDLRQAILAQAREVGADTTLGEDGRRAALARMDAEARAALAALYAKGAGEAPKAVEDLARDLQRAAAQAVRKGPR